MESMQLPQYLQKARITIQDSIYERFLLGCHIISSAELEIDIERRILRLRYVLPLDAEEKMWEITKAFRKESREGVGSYYSTYPYRIVFALLQEVGNVIYHRIARKGRWGLTVREKLSVPVNKDGSRCFTVQLRASSAEDFQGGIIHMIKKYDPAIYIDIMRRRELDRIRQQGSRKVIDRERKKLKDKIKKLTDRRLKEIGKQKLQNIYFERVKKAGLIGEQGQALVDNKKFVSLFKRLARKIVNDETPQYDKCDSCKETYEVLTKQQDRIYCYRNSCRQREYRINKIRGE